MPAQIHQFAKRLGVGIDVLEQFIASLLPALQSVVEQTADWQSKLPLGDTPLERYQPLAGIVDHDRHVLARQPRHSL